MSGKLPANYQPLLTAYQSPRSGQFFNVLGVVTDCMLPMPTRKDWMSTFTITDPAMYSGSVGDNGHKCRFFRPKREDLPRLQVGDVVILKNVKKMVFNGQPILVTNYNTQYAIFPDRSIPTPEHALSTIVANTVNMECDRFPLDFHPTLDEQMYAVCMRNEMLRYLPRTTQMDTSTTPSISNTEMLGPSHEVQAAVPRTNSLTQPPTAAGTRGKFVLIQDAQINTFKDIAVQVIKIFHPTASSFTDVYVTDYTSNSLLYDYAAPEETRNDERADGDQYGYMPQSKKDWPGPWGQTVLKVEVMSPHAEYLESNVKEGDTIWMSNIRIKMSQANKLEANLFRDSMNPDRINIRKARTANDDAVQELMTRREKYWQGREKITHAAEDTRTRNQKKKDKRKAREKAKLEKDAPDGEDALKLARKISTSPNIRCGYPEIALSTIRELLDTKGTARDDSGQDFDLPFINQKRKVKARVIDFFPRSLTDFTRPAPDESTTPTQASNSLPPASSRWIWDFFLLVEDISGSVPPADVWLHVPDDAAQFLLKLDAMDLGKHNDQALRLRETLFLLWGNLEEHMTAIVEPRPAVSNLPFECCISEYGQELDEQDREDPNKREWIKIYKMFGVTINSD